MPNVFHSVQYLKNTGVILGCVSGLVAIPDENFPEGVSQVVVESDQSLAAPDISGKRVNLQTLEIEPCPVLALQAKVNEVMTQLAECDKRRDRALAEAFVSGDNTWLKKHLSDADALRSQAADLNKQIAAVPAQVPA
jgi:hypothetical protein